MSATDEQLELDLRPEDRVEFDAWWLATVRQNIDFLAATGEVFSADTLRSDPLNMPEPRHGAHWGAAFSAALAAGVIKPVGFAASTTPSRHRGVLRLWRGGAQRGTSEES